MSLRRFFRAVVSEAGLIFSTGISFVFLGIHVEVTGLIRNIIMIGSARHLVAAVLLIFGAWLTFLGVKALRKAYESL